MSAPEVRPKIATTEQLDALDEFRLRCAELFDALPEPPVYKRADEPTRQRFTDLVPRVKALIGEGTKFEKVTAESSKEVVALKGVLLAMEETIDFAARDQFELAEEAWLKFCRLRAAALSFRKIWQGRDEVPASPVFDRETGSSRFDAVSVSAPAVQLVCPHRACRKTSIYDAALGVGRRELRCAHCAKAFVAYIAEVREVKVDSKSRGQTHYHLKLGESSGVVTKVQFADATSSVLRISRGDNLALIYVDRNQLRAGLNLNTGRVLWLTRGGPCFVATAVFGPEAPELAVFRAFRDNCLERRDYGRRLIQIYYFIGPALVRLIRAFRLKAPARRCLLWIQAALVRRGFS